MRRRMATATTMAMEIAMEMVAATATAMMMTMAMVMVNAMVMATALGAFAGKPTRRVFYLEDHARTRAHAGTRIRSTDANRPQSFFGV